MPYLRALAWGESLLTPSAKQGDARGLFQIVPVVLADYNRRAGATLAPSDLDPPEQNTMVAASALRAIVASYARNHRDVPNLLEDGTDPAFVELVPFDRIAKTITVNQQTRNGETTTPKGRTRRTIPMTDTLHQALRRLEVVREGLVVRNLDGTAKTDGSADAAIQRIGRGAGLPIRFWHILPAPLAPTLRCSASTRGAAWQRRANGEGARKGRRSLYGCVVRAKGGTRTPTVLPTGT